MLIFDKNKLDSDASWMLVLNAEH